MRLDHPIFQSPLAAKVPIDKDKPFEAAHDDQGTWRVFDAHFDDPKAPKGDWGVVSDGHGFEDSPDCERISGGINTKGPKAVAIGRQASMLQWGFYGAPDRMTESARRVFLNALVYMKRFDGEAPLVEKKAAGRTWLAQSIDALARMEPAELAKSDGAAKYYKSQFPAELTANGIDVAALRKWYQENEEYLFGDSRFGAKVDPDLRTAGVSNRKPEFLDWLVRRFGEDPKDALALRLAARYLGREHGKTRRRRPRGSRRTGDGSSSPTRAATGGWWTPAPKPRTTRATTSRAPSWRR